LIAPTPEAHFQSGDAAEHCAFADAAKVIVKFGKSDVEDAKPCCNRAVACKYSRLMMSATKAIAICCNRSRFAVSFCYLFAASRTVERYVARLELFVAFLCTAVVVATPAEAREHYARYRLIPNSDGTLGKMYVYGRRYFPAQHVGAVATAPRLDNDDERREQCDVTPYEYYCLGYDRFGF
jgi:hypothetical protein